MSGLAAKLCSPTVVGLGLLLISATVAQRKVAGRIAFWLALAVLLIGGNGCVAQYLTQRLEREYLPPNPVPAADCILVLGGGEEPKVPPRPTAEVVAAGDRIIYAAYLFRAGKAPVVLCSAGVSSGALGARPGSEAMAEILENVGVPKEAIVQETEARNTHEHGSRLRPVFEARGAKRVLLVTSAIHMPRAVSVLKRSCPGIEFIPAPADFRVVEVRQPWYEWLVNCIPTPGNYLLLSEAMHEYLGMAWYRLRGWM